MPRVGELRRRKITRRGIIILMSLAAAVLSVGTDSLTQTAIAGEPNGHSPSTWDSSVLDAEHIMLTEATQAAGKGEYAQAIAIISRDVRGKNKVVVRTNPDAFMFRVAAVSGFLRNQSKYVDASLFARNALASKDAEPSRAAKGNERIKVRYWRAQVLAEIIGDRDEALRCLKDKEQDELDDPLALELYTRLAPQAESSK